MSLSSTRPTKTAARASVRSNGGTLQAAKAAQTRKRLIDSTIQCLIKYGYNKTTTLKVAEEAGLSRGAMMHHFENGSALIKATVHELHEKRLRAFRRAVEKPEHKVDELIAAYWQQVQTPAFIAFHELAVAARTDKDLASILIPLQKEFRQRFDQQADDLFTEWRSSPEQFHLAMDLSQTILEGMAVALQTGAMSVDQTKPMLKYLEKQIRDLMPKE